MSFISQFISFDFFGVAPTLSYKGRGKSKSTFGSVCSYIMVGYIAVAMVYSFSGMVFRNNPNTVTEQVEGRVKGVPYGGDGFNIGLGFVSPFGALVNDPSINTVTFHRLSSVYNSAGVLSGVNDELLPLETCNTSHFQNAFNFNGRCLARNASTTVGTLSHSFLNFRIKRCVNATSNVTCKPSSVLDQIYNSHSLGLNYQSQYVTPGNYESPYSIKKGATSTRASAGLSKIVIIDLTEYEIQTDSGFIFPDIDVKSFIQVDNIKIDLVNDGQSSINIRIQMTGEKTVMKRSYPKIQQALAGTIALTRIGFLLCLFVVVPCTRITYYKAMLDELFTWPGQSSKKISVKNPEFFFKDIRVQNERRNSLKNNLNMNSSQYESNDSSKSEESKLKTDGGGGGALNTGQHTFMQRAILTNQQQGMKVPDSQRDQMVDSEETKNNEETQNTQNYADHESVRIDLKGNDNAIYDSNINSNTEKDNGTVFSTQTQQKGSQSVKPPSFFEIYLREKIPCLKSKQAKLFQKGEKEIKGSLSITALIQKVREVDRLKQVLFDKEQKYLFENAPKPLLTEANSKIDEVIDESCLEKNYLGVLNRNTKSIIDKNILELFMVDINKK